MRSLAIWRQDRTSFVNTKNLRQKKGALNDAPFLVYNHNG